jgi:CRISPR-associated protein Cas8a1/Csx13
MGKVETAKKASVGSPHAPLVIALNAPGMTPLLRAGVGGLAASLKAILINADRTAKWPSPIPLGKGRAVVERTRVTIEWGGDEPENVLRLLFAGSFQLHAPGVIELPGAWETATRPFDLAIATALQTGLKRTFLQHGSTTKKKGAATTHTLEREDGPLQVRVQAYSEFVHAMEGSSKIIEAIAKGTVDLPGWAYPGAAERHVGLGVTKCAYGPAEALAACFALVGCQSFEVPRSGGGGALVILEPSDLVQFAKTRPRLAPKKLDDAYVTGPGDAVLAVHLALRQQKITQSGIAATHGVVLKVLPWAKQQKSRARTVSVREVKDDILNQYETIRDNLPNKLVMKKEDDDEGDDEQDFFVATSALRTFAAENVATGATWFHGFATATTGGKKPRFIHYYRAKDAKNLGALYSDERKGMIAMTGNLEEANKILVQSVHTALRQRLGAIAAETQELPQQTRENRWQNEREKWRLAFAGAKTPEQIRNSLADLWSRAGSVKELGEHWQEMLPLLRPDHWEMARDLALVALASYQGKGTDHTKSDD